jgi:hypothetical protein
LTPESFADLIKTFGFPTAGLIFLLWSGARGMWVFGKTYNDLLEDRNYWRDLALKGTDLADKAVSQRGSRRAVRP